MKRFLASALLIGASTFGMVGCEGDKTEVKEEKTVTTPEGTTKETDIKKVESDSKDAPPATTPAPAPAGETPAPAPAPAPAAEPPK